jgi:uncharacterized membrane protein (DUF106 family)
MNKLDNFLSKHGIKVILVLLLLTFFRSCGTNSELKKVKKELQALQTQVKDFPSKKDLEIEGLKSEKRMIQSTDRKMMDVNRQSEIDKEINKLQSAK